MSKRSRPIKNNKKKKNTIVLSEDELARSKLPWFDAPREVVEYIHFFIPLKEVGCLLKLLHVSKTYHLYIEAKLQTLFTTIVDLRYSRPDHHFPLSTEWQSVTQLYQASPMYPNADRNDLMKRLSAFIEKHQSLCASDPVVSHNILALLNRMRVVHMYKPLDLKNQKTDWSFDRGKSKVKEHEYIPVGTHACYIYRYDKDLDQCISICREARVKRVINMPTSYGSKSQLRELVTHSTVSFTEKELLLRAIEKPGVEYTHCIAYIALGKNANHDKPARNSPLKTLVVEVENNKGVYLHIYASQMSEFRAKYFISRYDNAKEALIEYKVASWPKRLLEDTAIFLYPEEQGKK